jgi:hypothetical protein
VTPWERALAREPMCAFVEAVVDGYSPLDKHLCKLARAGALLRSLPWWDKVPHCWKGMNRGERRMWTGSVFGANQMSGEMPWR